jgi:hypothetical protein
MGICVYIGYYCSNSGVQSLPPPPPPAPSGYENLADPGTACDYNGVRGGAAPPFYQENFCMSCNDDCSTCQ